ncbi:glycosyltransferase [Marinomonas gallaica]|uniref:glycosyltransferase n=1 Tax=Marinomonas gallaica TaxID=1806667 RepID=UPI003A8F604E
MKRKIVIFQPEMCIGGVERVLINLLEELNYNKYDITIILRNKSVWDEDIPEQVQVKYLFKNNPRKAGPIISRVYKYGMIFVPRGFVRHVLKLDKYDIGVSFHEPMMYFLKGIKNKKISWIHTDYSVVKNYPEVRELKNKNGILSSLINKERNKLFGECDRIVCVAKSAIKGLANKANLNESMITYKYNLNDEVRIRRLANEKIEEISQEYFNICSVGRFVEQKAFDRFIHLAERLKNKSLKFKVYLIGDGPLKISLEEKIKKKRLQDYFVLTGYSENPYKYVAKCDLFVCSSLYEAFCTATTESIILGTPLVTTDCSGMRELVGDTNAGLIVENNEKDLAKKVEEVMLNPNLYNKMKEDAVSRSVSFERGTLIKSIEDMFDEI